MRVEVGTSARAHGIRRHAGSDVVALHLPMRHASMHAYCRSGLREGWLGRTERVVGQGKVRSYISPVQCIRAECWLLTETCQTTNRSDASDLASQGY